MVPAEILDSRPGLACLNPRFTWPGLNVTSQVTPHDDPDRKRPPERPYSQDDLLHPKRSG